MFGYLQDKCLDHDSYLPVRCVGLVKDLRYQIKSYSKVDVIMYSEFPLTVAFPGVVIWVSP